MPIVLQKIILSTLIISSGSLIGTFALSLSKKFLNKILIWMISLSAGTLMGGAMLHLLPESVEQLGSVIPFRIALFAFVLFFLVEKVLHWHHCHGKDCTDHENRIFGYLNLIGDTIHNFIDGLIIAATFITSPEIGIVTAVAIALHEIPQEIGDFGILVHSGFSKTKALTANLLVSTTIILGGIVGYYASQTAQFTIPYLLPFAAGGFIYIAAADLMPEIRKENKVKKAVLSLIVFLLGISIMLVLK